MVWCLNQHKSKFPFNFICDKILTTHSHGSDVPTLHRQVILSMELRPYMTALTVLHGLYRVKQGDYFLNTDK
jgi:hypothetical protein